MRKQSSKIFLNGEYHNEIVIDGKYHDMAIACYEDGDVEVVWEKLNSKLTPLLYTTHNNNLYAFGRDDNKNKLLCVYDFKNEGWKRICAYGGDIKALYNGNNGVYGAFSDAWGSESNDGVYFSGGSAYELPTQAISFNAPRNNRIETGNSYYAFANSTQSGTNYFAIVEKDRETNEIIRKSDNRQGMGAYLNMDSDGVYVCYSKYSETTKNTTFEIAKFNLDTMGFGDVIMDRMSAGRIASTYADNKCVFFDFTDAGTKIYYDTSGIEILQTEYAGSIIASCGNGFLFAINDGQGVDILDTRNGKQYFMNAGGSADRYEAMKKDYTYDGSTLHWRNSIVTDTGYVQLSDYII